MQSNDEYPDAGLPPGAKPVIQPKQALPHRQEAAAVKIVVFDYTASFIERHDVADIKECSRFKTKESITWINVDGLRKADVDLICHQFNIHPLIAEDILSINQRPKMDEGEGILYCLLNMLFFNDEKCIVEQEQISIVLGKNYVLSFQEDAERDVFDPIREKLNNANSRLRQRGADYLYYALLDMIVDNYVIVMEKLGDKIEALEDKVAKMSNARTLAEINQLRKELIILKRNIAPAREIINGLIRSESDLLDDRITIYLKDVYDHIVQAYELTENYRDMMMSLQDLYLNNVNLRMNEVMKVMAIVTCLMAPATVIGGIFGMNFERIPILHNRYGFFIAVGLMLIIPVWMLVGFRKKGWF